MTERTCWRCDDPLPAPSPKGGRPARFCSASCRNSWHYEVAQEREYPTSWETLEVSRWEAEFYGREEAERNAARRRRLLEEAHGARATKGNG